MKGERMKGRMGERKMATGRQAVKIMISCLLIRDRCKRKITLTDLRVICCYTLRGLVFEYCPLGHSYQ
jgi:hypothetical protein